MSIENVKVEYDHRQALTMVIASMCIEAGYDSAQELVLETLTEILQSYLTEIGNSTRSFYEHGGRTVPTGHDVLCAFADAGFSNRNLLQYIRRIRRVNLGQLNRTSEPSSPPVLQVGKRKNFPNYISESYNYPHYPDPHAYIRTTTGQKPETDYVILRERLSAQKRDVERALTRFVAKTGKSHALLSNDKNAFPLIAAQPSAIPYLVALLPSEHETVKVFDSKVEGTKEVENKVVDQSKSKSRKIKRKGASGENDAQSSEINLSDLQDVSLNVSSQQTNAANEQPSMIHNPYLRPVKRPKSKRKT